MRLWASRGPSRGPLAALSRPPAPFLLLLLLLLSSRSLSFFSLFYMRLARPSRDLSFAEGAQAREDDDEKEEEEEKDEE